jgi:glycosyltransferase involved in cell wall biosynthesis/peptidoglycan/xylan/chitin deacetylase (PgdA/CDA1 family)
MATDVLRVLTYHRVLEPTDRSDPRPASISATPATFEQQMRHVAKRYRAVSAEEVLAAVRGERALPPKAVLVTFDDAYRDFGEVAWPIMRRHRIPATLFVPTAFPDHPEREFWWDRLHRAFRTAARPERELRDLEARLKSAPHADAMRTVEEVCARLGSSDAPVARVLAWRELRELARDGVTLAPHTRTHPALSRLPLEQARAEIRGSRDDLRREIGDVTPMFAYPFGAHDDLVVRLMREEGFEVALTCIDGHNRLTSTDPLRLSRTNVSTRTTAMIFRARLHPAVAMVDRWRHRPRRSTAVAGVNWMRADPPLSPTTSMPSTPRDERALRAATGDRPRVAYLVSRFPKLTETFVLYEMIALEELGVAVELYPLLRARQRVAHPEADRWTRRARFQPFVSLEILRAQLHFLRRDPRRYATLLAEVLRETWGSTNFFLGALAYFPKAVRFALEMEREGVTHVHAHFCSHPALVAFIIHRLTDIPYSFTAHGSDLHVERRMLPVKVDHAAFAVTVSDYNRRLMLRECGQTAADRIRVVRCGVDPGLFATREHPRREGPTRILCVASFEKVKGHEHLLDACALLRDRGVEFVCDLVGEGPLRRDAESRIARLGLRGVVRALGSKPRPEVIRMLREADVAVLASQMTKEGKREGIPVALMEAMAAGLPVVASAISGIPELVEDSRTGILVRPGDPNGLADALHRLAADADLRRRMGAAGRRRVTERFNLQTNTAELMQLFLGSVPTPHQRRTG